MSGYEQIRNFVKEKRKIPNLALKSGKRPGYKDTKIEQKG
jgi:hypothetical protein